MKLVNREKCQALVRDKKAAGKTIVFTNGCFDVLHVGHIRYLTEAKALGDILIVGLNSDHSVQCLKGPTRPINNALDRAEVLSALEMVDHIVIFDELTASGLIRELCPDIYVKGGDYQPDNLPEAEAVKECGGKIKIVSLVPGRSSSAIIQRLASRPGAGSAGKEGGAT